MKSGAGSLYLLFLLQGCYSIREARQGEGEKEHPRGLIERALQRRSEDGTVPANALMRAKAQKDSLLAAQRSLVSRPLGPCPKPWPPQGIASGGWAWLGPGNIGGRVRAIVAHPTQPGTMWIGSASGGIWKTTGGGGSWSAQEDFMASLAVGCMAIDPANPDVVYAGSGETHFKTSFSNPNADGIRGAGIFKTSDGGDHWTQLPSTTGPEFYWVNRLAIHPVDTQTLLAATDSGIFRSEDGGKRWLQLTSARAFEVQFDPWDPGRAVAGQDDGIALFSMDAGQTWQPASGLTGYRVILAYARSQPDWVYAAVSSAPGISSGSLKIWRSEDGGKSYTLRTAGGGISTWGAYTGTLWVDPTNANQLVYGGVSLYKSVDGGIGSSSISGGHPDYHVVVEEPNYDGATANKIFVGNDGGIYRKAGVAGGATELNNQLGITQFYGGAVNPTSGVVWGGTQDNGTLRYSGNPEGWTSVGGGDGGFCASDPTDPAFFWGESQEMAIFRSPSGFTKPPASHSNFIAPFILDPNDPNRLLAGGSELWRTNNAKGTGQAWAAIKPAIPDCQTSPATGAGGGQTHFDDYLFCDISAIAAAEGNSELVWVGHNNGDIFKAENGTAASPVWVKVDESYAGLPNRWVSRIAIDPKDHDRVTVSLMGYEPDNLWRTQEGGGSWGRITGVPPFALPSAPVSAIALHRLFSGWIYVGTDVGVFFSWDGGSHWSTSLVGPANVSVEELVWKNDRDLLAVTFGRGMYLGPTFEDCNQNLVPDPKDIASGLSLDRNENCISDECE